MKIGDLLKMTYEERMKYAGAIKCGCCQIWLSHETGRYDTDDGKLCENCFWESLEDTLPDISIGLPRSIRRPHIDID